MEMPNPQIPLSIRPPEGETPFQMAGQALNLEKALGQRKERQAQEQDDASLKQYLSSGGNISTPEGLQKAVTDLQGKVSPEMTMKLSQASQNSERVRTESVLALSKASEQEFASMQNKFQFMDESLTNSMDAYNQAAKEKGSQAALQAFDQSKQEIIARAQQMKGANGQPIFSPDMLQQYATMNPAQVASLQTTVKHQRELAKEAADLRYKQAQAVKDEAEAYAKRKEGEAGKKIPISSVATISDDSAKFYAKAYKKNPLVLQGLRSADRLKVMENLVQQGDISPEELAVARQEFMGLQVEERTIGTRAGQATLAANEAKNMSGLVLQTLEPLGLTNFVPFNKALNAYNTKTGDPKIIAYGTALNSFVNTYSRAISPTGVPTDQSRQHAYDLLNTANSPAQVKAALKIMNQEMDAALQAPKQARQEIREEVSGKKPEKEPVKLSAQDQKAVDWAKAHPNDKRAKDILKLHGM